jgi:predicted AlkP superfamily phosphohydrolase/phosphomutase
LLWWWLSLLPVLRHTSWLAQEVLLARLAPLMGASGARLCGGEVGRFLIGATLLVAGVLPGTMVLLGLHRRLRRPVAWWSALTAAAYILIHGWLWGRSASALALGPAFRPLRAALLLGLAAAVALLVGGLSARLISVRWERRLHRAVGWAALTALLVSIGFAVGLRRMRGPTRGGGVEAGGAVAVKPMEGLFLLGLDGVGWEWLSTLPGAGTHFDRWARSGLAAPLSSIHPALSPPVWTTIATGKRPWQHGIAGFVFEGDAAVPAHAGYRRARPLWEILNTAGRRSLVVNWYVTWPASLPDDAGVLVSDRYLLRSLEQRVAPAMESATVDSIVDYYRRDVEALVVSVAGPEPDAAAAPVANGAWRHFHREVERDYLATRVFLHYLRHEGPWDFTALYLRGTDGAQHRYWREHVVAHGPALSRWAYRVTGAGTDPGPYGDLLVNYYRLVDRWLDEIEAVLGSGARMMAVSDHGVGVRLGDPGRAQLDPLLERLGHLRRTADGSVDRQASALWDATPGGRHDPRERRIGVGSGWSAEAAARELLALRTTEGNPVFSSCEGGAGVIEVEINRGLSGGSAVTLPNGGAIPVKQFAAVAIEGDFTGAHRMDGIFLSSFAASPGRVRRGYSVLDITPTLLEAMGLPAANDMEGDAIERLLGGLPRPRIPTWEDGRQVVVPAPLLSPEADEEIRRDLRALGYID